MLRGLISGYNLPNVVTIHSISFTWIHRIVLLLILFWSIIYIIPQTRNYQEYSTSIISSVIFRVKGIHYNPIIKNQAIIIDDAGEYSFDLKLKSISLFSSIEDYRIAPLENNALFVMTNSIEVDQEYKRCPDDSPYDMESTCLNDDHCRLNIYPKGGNRRWTGRCLMNNSSSNRNSEPVKGRCELEGWCPVINDYDIPQPSVDTLNISILIKNFIEFPRFRVIRKNIDQSASYLKKCNFDSRTDVMCPIFRVGTLLDMVEPDLTEQVQMLKYGGVIRVKIDWICNLDKPLDQCSPHYSFGRLDAPFKKESLSHGFNFRYATHWKRGNRTFRTLTKAFGLRFIVSVNGVASRLDLRVFFSNIVFIIGLLCLFTFIYDIVGVLKYCRSDVYRQGKSQDVHRDLTHLETLNTSSVGMMNEGSRRQNEDQLEQVRLTK